MALRMCVLNHLTQEADVRWTLGFIARTPLPAGLLTSDGASSTRPDGPLISLLSPEARKALDQRCFERVFPAGSAIVSRWATDRDFYIVLSGHVSVSLDGERISSLGPGDFFGEIAASDWGSGYGYLRTADVKAESDASILLVPADVFGDMLKTEPALRERVQAARGRRLTRM
jgi:CRP-like cAMP-binding protein